MSAAATLSPHWFGPPPPRPSPFALGWAGVAHALLIVSVVWAAQWRPEPEPEVFVAELWANQTVQSAPQAGAEAAVITPPNESPPIEATKDSAVAEPASALKNTPPPDIALEADKPKRKDKEKEKDKEPSKAEKPAAKGPTKAEKAELAREREREALRQENIQRMLGLAGAGKNNDKGQADRSAAPSAAYAGLVKARIKPNIVFGEDVTGNPRAEIEVRAAPEGTIIARKIVKSSGVKAWDEAVLRAIDRTDTLPRDTDGRVPSALIIGFTPKD
jgi:colicin import membrane protein